jgi:hypothetical protein
MAVAATDADGGAGIGRISMTAIAATPATAAHIQTLWTRRREDTVGVGFRRGLLISLTPGPLAACAAPRARF